MFHCVQCGECCRNLRKSALYKELDRGDGTCIYLNKNKCSIYEERPLICRVDECYEEVFKKIYTIEEYYKLNYQACDMLQKNKK